MSYLDPVRDFLDEQLPGIEPELLDLYTLLAFVKGKDVTREDVHDAWALWRRRTRPDHRSLIPFSELNVAVQELDEKYVQVIKAAVR